jgi:hypothetical protein
MATVTVAVVVVVILLLAAAVFRPHISRILAAGAEPEPRGFGDDGPDATGVREPRTPKPSARGRTGCSRASRSRRETLFHRGARATLVDLADTPITA